ncbi:MAG: IS200/IS605 family transposase [Proteobacteria bacterium]|nr:MAG: IS200/IS605 family transposase [Pseudomonadota bacterium]
MDQYRSLSHSKWECKYHVVFIPKYRRKLLYKPIRKELGEVFHRLSAQKASRIEDGHTMPDHVHVMLLIPPKYAVSQVSEFYGSAFLGAGILCLEGGKVEAVKRQYIRD